MKKFEEFQKRLEEDKTKKEEEKQQLLMEEKMKLDALFRRRKSVQEIKADVFEKYASKKNN